VSSIASPPVFSPKMRVLPVHHDLPVNQAASPWGSKISGAVQPGRAADAAAWTRFRRSVASRRAGDALTART
jgi:hypothetical protein